jgi:hypothetical protein
MNSANFDELKEAVKNLADMCVLCMSTVDTADCDETVAVERRLPVDEESVMANYGHQLRCVTNLRDTYNAKACDICERIRSDLATLASYVDKPGFGTAKMEYILETLYVNKSKHDDVDMF